MPAEQRRRQLLKAAHRLFMKKGYRETTTEQIARRAGLTKGALYFHFRNKEDILFELVRMLHYEILQAFAALPRGKASPVDTLRVLFERGHHSGSVIFGNYLDFWVQASRIPKANRYLRTCFEGYNRAFAESIDRRYAPTARDRRDLAMLVLSMYDGLTARKLLGDEMVDFPRQLRLFSHLLEGRVNTQTKVEKHA